MEFLETPRFPTCPSFGYTAEPVYNVTAVRTAGGHESQNRNWSRPLHRFNCRVGPRAIEEVAELHEFYHAMGGPFVGFRFKDYADFKSCRAHETVTPLDAPVVLDEDLSPDAYRLVKRYTYGVRTQDREITKPVAGTVRLASDGVEMTEGVDWTIDETTGIVTLNFSPVGVLTWGGEFDGPARFDSEFPVEIMDSDIHTVQFTIMELRL